MTKAKIFSTFLLLSFVSTLSGCFTNSDRVYQTMKNKETISGVVIYKKQIVVEGHNGVGLFVGALLGMAIAQKNTHAKKDKYTLPLAGAIMGAAFGGAVQQGASSKSLVKYVIKADSGRIFTITSKQTNFQPKDRIYLTLSNIPVMQKRHSRRLKKTPSNYVGKDKIDSVVQPTVQKIY